jgi:GNAT superfamily N-acetyltransferase
MSYVKDFYNAMWAKVNMNRSLFRAYRDYRLFGFGALLVSDDYTFSTTLTNGETYKKETILDFNDIEKSIKTLALSRKKDKNTLKVIDEITSKYLKNREDVTLEELQKVIYSFIPNYQDNNVVKRQDNEEWVEKYKGLKFVKNIDPFEALNRSTNDDIDFVSISLRGETRFKDLFSEGGNKLDESESIKVLRSLEALGYSKSYIEGFKDQETIDVNSYPYNDSNMWIAFIENEVSYSDTDKSILNRVLKESIDLVVVHKANRLKANRAYKNIYLFNSDVTGDNFTTIDGLIREAVNKDESSYIFTNKAISADNISFDSRELISVDDIAEKAEDTLLQGLGMVETLVGGSDSYANSYLQLEMLGNQFTIERQILKKFIEEQILKPVAVKKGLYIKDEWGNIEYLYPRVEFDRLNLAHSSDDFQLLLDLASNKKIPYSYVVKALGFNIHEIERMLIEEQTSPLSEGVANFVTEKILENDNFAEIVIRDRGYLKGVVKALGLDATDSLLDKIVSAISKGDDEIPTEDIVEEVSDNLYRRWEELEEERKSNEEAQAESQATEIEDKEIEEEELRAFASSDHSSTSVKEGVKSIRALEGVEDFKAKVEKIGGINTIIITRLVIKKEKRKQGIGTLIANTIKAYAKARKMGIALNVKSDLGATSKNRLIRFFKKIDLVENKGKNRQETIPYEMYLKKQ